MTVKVLTAPVFEPVSLADARRWLRLEDDDTANTAVLQLLVQAMREDAENLTSRSFVQRRLKLTLDDWPYDSQYGAKIVLPYPPLVSVESFKYVNYVDGIVTDMDAATYVVHDECEPAFIIPAYLAIWPTIRAVPDALQIIYRAGYAAGSPGDSESDAQANIPAKLKLWMEAKLATHNEFREMMLSGTIVNKIPRDFTDGLLDSLVVGTRPF